MLRIGRPLKVERVSKTEGLNLKGEVARQSYPSVLLYIEQAVTGIRQWPQGELVLRYR